MKSVLMSINSVHNANIESGLKLSELRTRPPKLNPPFKVYTYESGALGRHKVVNGWICNDMETWRICMGMPAHLSKNACVSDEFIWKYTNFGYKDITEMKISNLVIYDKPKELSEFYSICEKRNCHLCDWEREYDSCGCNRKKPITRPPQSWCYVDHPTEKGGVE